MSSFELAIPVILEHEGGWVSDPADPGGETNFGISTLIIARESMTNADLGLPEGRSPGWLRALTAQTATGLYQRLFWDKYQYGRVEDQTAATKIFDCAVNCGPTRSHELAQRVAGSVVDGVLGPLSTTDINAMDPAEFVRGFRDQMRAYYQDIVQRKPTLAKFLNNWLRRADWGL